MSTLLAFDTATDRMAVALVANDRVWAHEGEAGAQASLQLLPAIFGLLDQAGLALHRLDAIAFGRGPGAFTGLRTACSVAQGLAIGAGKPVLALDTLMAIVEDAHLKHGADAWWAAMDARMNEIYAAQYRLHAARWRVVSAPALYSIEALQECWAAEAPQGVAGSAIEAFAGRLRYGPARLARDALPSPQALLSLARAAWADGAALDASQAVPLYLRDKVALTVAERDALRGAKARSVSGVR